MSNQLKADPSRPKTLGFVGSEDYIRLQFEEYVLSMVSAVKYHLFMLKHAGSDQNVFLPDIGKSALGAAVLTLQLTSPRGRSICRLQSRLCGLLEENR
jgi:hypothetical protein